METLAAFMQGLLNYALAFVRLVIDAIIYVLSFVISLLNQLLNVFV